MNKQQADELSLLYQRGRHEWDERMGSVTHQAHVWKLAFFAALAITALSVGGVIYIGSQSKIEPYAVAINNGEVMATGKMSRLPQGQLNALQVKALTGFIENMRNVMVDVSAQKSAIIKAYAMMQNDSPAYLQANAHFKQQSPFARAETELVKVEVITVLPLSPDTYQAEWKETVTARSGKATYFKRYKATLNTITQFPTTQTALNTNPLGFFIRTFNDVEVH